MIYDVSPVISLGTPVWPGDTPPTREVLMDLARGDTVTLSTLRSTVHLAAHADGENHYLRGGRDVGAMPLEHYLGPCVVVDAAIRGRGGGGVVRPADVAGGLAAIAVPRVLVKTGTFPGGGRWESGFAGLSVELIDALAALPVGETLAGHTARGGDGGRGGGVFTIGTDCPSVDPQESKTLAAHAAVARHGMAILEGLDLRGVPAGEYELIALPLRLEGFDGSPVRAVLRTVSRPRGARP